jgi:hypothetical protein
MCDPETHITIDKVDSEAGKDLLGCYFRYVTERDELFIYRFFNQNGEELIGDLHVGSRFDCRVGDKNFALNIMGSSCEMVRGLFTDAINGEPDQSYQAGAGGTVADGENAASANV